MMGGAGIGTAGAFIGAGIAAATNESAVVGVVAFLAAGVVSFVAWSVSASAAGLARRTSPGSTQRH